MLNSDEEMKMLYNKLNRNEYGQEIKGNLFVPKPQLKELYSFIDDCLLTHAKRNRYGEYQLYAEDLPKKTILNFVIEALNHDTSIRDELLYRMQQLIDDRMPEFEEEQEESIRDYHNE